MAATESEEDRLRRVVKNQQWQIDYMCEEIAKVFNEEKASPSDTVWLVRTWKQCVDAKS